MARVFAAIRRIIECSPLLRDEAKITTDKITINDAVIIAIPSNYASAAGSNQVVAVFDELWGYVSERSRRLFDELVPPPTRRMACRLTVTYAGFENESILLEKLYRRGLQQPRRARSLCRRRDADVLEFISRLHPGKMTPGSRICAALCLRTNSFA